MNIPINVAVRVFAAGDQQCVVQSIPAATVAALAAAAAQQQQSDISHPNINNNQQHQLDMDHKKHSIDSTNGQHHFHPGYIQVDSRSFPFTHTLPINCSQDSLYMQSVFPMLGMFLEGYDASFVTYGQSGTGKTYTMLGPGLNCVYGEAEQGIVLRCVRDIFGALSQHRDRNFAVHIGWVEVDEDEIHDLFQNSGNVPCASVGDVFHWLQVGLANRKNRGTDVAGSTAHSIFTLTLEQQWVTPVEGLIQHRLSTASFCDLASTDRVTDVTDGVSVPKDTGLRALEDIVDDLATIEFGDQDPAYTRTTLTTLLKDSFGGRAQTLLILCVSGHLADISETVHNLQFACKAQCVRNYVVVNEFSDNNTPLNAALVAAGRLSATDGGGGGPMPGDGGAAENYGLQFAASQWLKLVSNAEGLFSRLIESKGLDEKERERIEEWMFLKQECEECLSSGEMQLGGDHRHLGPIQEEASEPEETDDEDEEEGGEKSSCQQNTDNDSDSESQHLADLEDRVVQLIDEFRTKTDIMVREQYDVFVAHHPKAVLVSSDQLEVGRTSSPHRTMRRKSFQPGDNLKLSTQDIERLNIVAEKPHGNDDPFVGSSDDFLLRSVTRDPMEQLVNELRKVRCDIEAAERQCTELEGTVQTKQELITTLSGDAHNRAGFQKKRAKLEADYQKCKKNLNKAADGRKCNRSELDRLRAQAQAKKQLLTDFVSLNNHEECTLKIKMHQKDQKAAKKKLDALHNGLKKNRRLEAKLLTEQKKIAKASCVGGGSGTVATTTAVALALTAAAGSGGRVAQSAVEVSERISQLDQVIKEKSLKQYADNSSNSDLFRHEIRQLRLTRDQLVDQRCTIDLKLKHEKRLSHEEQRKLYECDEGIEAIDAAIEYKNELICGSRRSVDMTASMQREKGSRMMMARLNNLSVDEMRVLLYKYFQKAIDFRDNSQQMEKDRDHWESREMQTRNEMLRMVYEHERRVAMLHHQHEVKLAMYMRIINDSGLTDTMSSSATSGVGGVAFSNNVSAGPGVDQRILAIPGRSRHLAQLDLAPVIGNQQQQMVKAGRQHHRTTEIHHRQRHLSTDDPFKAASAFDKYKEKEKSQSSSFFSKIQMFKAHYGSGGGLGAKVHDSSMTGPAEQQLRQWCGGNGGLPITGSAAGAGTKVTREKNKLVIQQEGSR